MAHQEDPPLPVPDEAGHGGERPSVGEPAGERLDQDVEAPWPSGHGRRIACRGKKLGPGLHRDIERVGGCDLL